MNQTSDLFQLGALILALAFSTNLQAGAGGNGNGGGGGGGKPGGGGDSGGISLARIQVDPSGAVRGDGVQACGPWDYWDHRDTGLVCAGGSTADVSGGGRVHFNTINLQGTEGPLSSPRWLVLDFNGFVQGDPDPNIDAAIYDENDPADPPIDLTKGIDNVKTLVVLDNMFKKNARRASLAITIRNCDDPDGCAAAPTGYTLSWVEELNIEDQASGVRVLTTEGTSALADLFYDDDGDPGTPSVHIGRYYMPVRWTMVLVP